MSQVKCVQFTPETEAGIHLVRHTVFTAEQNVDAEIDFDGLDSQAVHAIVMQENQVVATGRMLEDGHIGRIAVLAEYRGLKLGAKIVNALINEATNLAYPRVYLGSQIHAVGFYQKLGFTPFGDQYVEANIEHQSMEKLLATNH
ncbi:GNAT family N-acetyltransferase [Vibrio sp. SS-MA-C1-2]|uniref:GNAT family N-acetyltransferase n=1 Tax=Vibrio sp. SS-MA-C1-2 TaxID=2908646 RepID=UPI001F1B0B86|nr:GNAT family N-acetyltransferase [Vibrio sp. SS-MA-C1-2]UJF18736.1 GNAT family N-acetyltransferase [Vibrio sp. SS-MA-C1-2]